MPPHWDPQPTSHWRAVSYYSCCRACPLRALTPSPHRGLLLPGQRAVEPFRYQHCCSIPVPAPWGPHCIPGGNFQPRSTLAQAPRPFSNKACASNFIEKSTPRLPPLELFSHLELILPTSPSINHWLQAEQLVQKDVWVSLLRVY